MRTIDPFSRASPSAIVTPQRVFMVATTLVESTPGGIRTAVSATALSSSGEKSSNPSALTRVRQRRASCT